MNKLFRRFIATGAAVVILVSAAIPAGAAAGRFRDVAQGTWYYNAVDYVSDVGLFSGTSADTFSPNTPMTRGMFVRVLANKAKIKTSDYTGSSFSDVKPGAWYASSVEWAAGNGIVSGIGGGRFAPNQSVTREQMALILYRYAKYAGCDMSTMAGALDRFPDGNRTSSYAKYAMEWAVTHKMLAGAGGKLEPQGTATRAQVAQIFYNSRELLEGSETPEPPSPPPAVDPDTPKIIISDEVRAKLRPNQDPEKILDYVLNGKHDDPTFPFDGTSAEWDPSLESAADVGIAPVGSWINEESDQRSSSAIANSIQKRLTRTDSDRFYITADESIGGFCLYYHPAEKPDSAKMTAIKQELSLPSGIKYDRGLCYEGAGWAGPMRWDLYGGADGIAEKVEYYLTDMHQAVQYYLTEPEPGVFYLLYGE